MRNPASQALRVFIIEDHDETRSALQRYVEGLGHKVIGLASSGQEAISALPGSDCDVLISDLGLPDIDGWDVLRAVRFPRPVYTIAFSGFDAKGDVARSEKAGFRHHLAKPMTSSSLEAMLDEAVREKVAAAG